MPEYIVIDEDGTQVRLADWQEDIFDEDTDKIFREVTWHDHAVLNPKYGEWIDQMIAPYRKDLEHKASPDTMRIKIEVTIGDLRRINCIAGLLQQQSRVRNPEILHMNGLSES